MTRPMSIRFDADVWDRLDDRRSRTGIPTSSLVQRLVDEGLRQGDHPGIVFRDGPTGRRAGLAAGPDVAEVVQVVIEGEERGDAALVNAAADLTLTPRQVDAAMAYYAAFSEEIDAEIRRRREESDRAYDEWLVVQRLLQ